MRKSFYITLIFRRQYSIGGAVKMSVIASKFNMMKGIMEWDVMNKDYDYCQEIARSAYADMLSDSERNKKYEKALELAIEKTKRKCKNAIVLDIGTGTGLLAMMAARHNADFIYACEAFKPMSDCAEKVVERNGFKDKIKIIHKRSTDVIVGIDMPQKANILVTEVFDTELIGEGAITTFNHAHQHLLEPDCIVIPSMARVYAMIFESEFVRKWYEFGSHTEKAYGMVLPDSVKNCRGTGSVFDLQLSQLSTELFQQISDPEIVLNFNWSSPEGVLKRDHTFKGLKSKKDGSASGVFMWWDLIMDTEGEIVLSCSPDWAKKPGEHLHWRDHWMQAIYSFPKTVDVKSGQILTLETNHDEFSLWFNLYAGYENEKRESSVPICSCGLHLVSKARMGMINDEERIYKYRKVLSEIVDETSVVLCLGDCTFLDMMCASLGAKRILVVQENFVFCKAKKSIVELNKLQEKVTYFENSHAVKSYLEKNSEIKVTLVVGDPYFTTAILPWYNMRMWYSKEEILGDENVPMIPAAGEAHMTLVQFDHLYKIVDVVNDAEGFDLEPFYKIVKKGSGISDTEGEVQPLWEYPCVPLAHPIKLMRFDFGQQKFSEGKQNVYGKLTFKKSGKWHAAVIWMDWHLNEHVVISQGPVIPVAIGEKIEWDKHTKQGIIFTNGSDINIQNGNVVEYCADFNPEIGRLDIEFSL